MTKSKAGWIGLVALALAVFVVLFLKVYPGSRPYDSARELAADIECVSFEQRDVGNEGVDAGRCSVDGQLLGLTVFDSDSLQDGVVASMKRRVRADPAYLVIGDRFLVNTDSYVLASQVADAVGGRVEQT